MKFALFLLFVLTAAAVCPAAERHFSRSVEVHRQRSSLIGRLAQRAELRRSLRAERLRQKQIARQKQLLRQKQLERQRQLERLRARQRRLELQDHCRERLDSDSRGYSYDFRLELDAGRGCVEFFRY